MKSSSSPHCLEMPRSSEYLPGLIHFDLSGNYFFGFLCGVPDSFSAFLTDPSLALFLLPNATVLHFSVCGVLFSLCKLPTCHLRELQWTAVLGTSTSPSAGPSDQKGPQGARRWGWDLTWQWPVHISGDINRGTTLFRFLFRALISAGSSSLFIHCLLSHPTANSQESEPCTKNPNPTPRHSLSPFSSQAPCPQWPLLEPLPTSLKPTCYSWLLSRLQWS